MAQGDGSSFRIVVLSGPSGSGKTTVVDRLLECAPVKLIKSVSATTRAPRDGEQHGERYYFLSSQEFESRRVNGDFVETAQYAGAWYGTLWTEVDRAKSLGGWPLLEIEVQGALRVMQMFPEAITIFLLPPSMEACEQRLRARGTESEEVIQRRLRKAEEELSIAPQYRYQVVNDELDRAVDDIGRILQTERSAAI